MKETSIPQGRDLWSRLHCAHAEKHRRKDAQFYHHDRDAGGRLSNARSWNRVAVSANPTLALSARDHWATGWLEARV